MNRGMSQCGHITAVTSVFFNLTDVKDNRGGRAKHNFLIDVSDSGTDDVHKPSSHLLSVQQNWPAAESVLSFLLSFCLFLFFSVCFPSLLLCV